MHRAVSFLVSWAYTDTRVSRALLQQNNFKLWLRQLVLLAKEVRARLSYQTRPPLLRITTAVVTSNPINVFCSFVCLLTCFFVSSFVHLFVRLFVCLFGCLLFAAEREGCGVSLPVSAWADPGELLLFVHLFVCLFGCCFFRSRAWELRRAAACIGSGWSGRTRAWRSSWTRCWSSCRLRSRCSRWSRTPAGTASRARASTSTSSACWSTGSHQRNETHR